MNITPSTASFLNTVGFSIDDQRHSHIGDATLEPSDNLITPLTHYGFLSVKGPDSAQFLQGQMTCNLDEIDDEHCRLGAYCTPKGRMVCSFMLGRNDPQSYLLRMQRPLVEPTLSRLQKYIVFSKAQQSDASDDYIAIGLLGGKTSECIINTFSKCPESQYESIHHQGNVVIQLDEAGTWFECWIESSQLEKLWPLLSKGLHCHGSKTWELLLIRHGLGEVTAATQEMFIPQMLNYQLTGTISFNKGCYTGQEIVARMQYHGKSKRRMYHVQTTTQPLPPGTELFSPEGSQSVGNIVTSVSFDNAITEALAVIAIKNAEEDTVLSSHDGLPLQLLPLPYAITSGV